MPDFLTNLAEGIIDPQGFVAQRRQDRDMDSYLRAVGAQQNQQAPPQQAAPQQQQMPTPFHMERLAGQFPANEGQIVPTLMQGRPAVLPASLPSAPDDPWKKAEVAKHEQSIGMIQQDQSLNQQQKMHAISRIGEQMDALDPQRQYRRGSPGSQMTRAQRFVAENVVPRYHPTTGEYMGDFILDGKGGATYHQHKPEKDTEEPYHKRYLDVFKAMTYKDEDGITHHPSPEEVHGHIAAIDGHSGIKQPQQGMSTGIQGGFGIQVSGLPTSHAVSRHQQELERRQQADAEKQREAMQKERERMSKEYDDAHKLLYGHEGSSTFIGTRTEPAARHAGVQAYLKAKHGFLSPAQAPKPSEFLKTLHAQPKLSLEEAKKAAAQKPRVTPPPRPKVDPYEASGNVPMGSY